MDKQIVVPLYSGVLSNKKIQTTGTCNVDESQMHYAK